MLKIETETSAPEWVEKIVHDAEAAGASDVHLQMNHGSAQVTFRLDGVMSPVSVFPRELAERVIGRIKFLARLKTYQASLPQEGRIDRAELSARQDIRVASYPTVTGEKIVLRLFTETGAKSLHELELAPAIHEELQRFLKQTSGLLLLTGPAGSGKTTTIYGCLRYLSELGGRHIITIEDPAEQVIEGVMQTEVNEARGLTFAKAARHLLRQDPQVLVIGEIRDNETANLAVRAALTGHMVIATVHAGSCRGVFERLLTMCDDRYSAVTSVELVVNQRLVRRLCSGCRGEGCDRCLKTGYRGRVPVAEWIRLDEAQRRRIREEGPAIVEPIEPLARAARALFAGGLTDEAELRRILGE